MSSTRFTTKRIFAKLQYWMEHHPIASNSFLTLNLWIAGDILAQYSEHKLLHSTEEDKKKKKKKKDSSFLTKIDTTRTVQCASYGAIVTGPLLAVWYPYLDKLCTVRFKSMAVKYGPWGAPIAKVLADEFLMDPPCLVAFYGYMNACEGGTWETFQHKLESEFMTSWLTSLAVWPVVLLGTFRYLPVYAQAPLINACCIVWDGFLSHRNAVAKHKELTTAESLKIPTEQQKISVVATATSEQ